MREAHDVTKSNSKSRQIWRQAEMLPSAEMQGEGLMKGARLASSTQRSLALGVYKTRLHWNGSFQSTELQNSSRTMKVQNIIKVKILN
jgi:hypothetical protein